MKVYQVFDDCIKTKITTDRIAMLEELYRLLKKHKAVQDWLWVDEEDI